MRRIALSLAALLVAASSPPSPFELAEPYRILQDANRTHDPAKATSAYTPDGILTFDYAGRPREEHRGRDAIHASYVRFFQTVDRGTPVQLDFRFDPPGPSGPEQSGVYRIMARVGGQPIQAYGRFRVRLRQDEGMWRFAEDHGSAADADDFERMAEAVG